jgi:hypothetical protein
MPRPLPDPSPESARRRGVAKLLATGLLRFHRRVQPALLPRAQSAQNELDECGETRPHAATGPAVNAAGDPEKGSHVQRG